VASFKQGNGDDRSEIEHTDVWGKQTRTSPLNAVCVFALTLRAIVGTMWFNPDAESLPPKEGTMREMPIKRIGRHIILLFLVSSTISRANAGPITPVTYNVTDMGNLLATAGFDQSGNAIGQYSPTLNFVYTTSARMRVKCRRPHARRPGPQYFFPASPPGFGQWPSRKLMRQARKSVHFYDHDWRSTIATAGGLFRRTVEHLAAGGIANGDQRQRPGCRRCY